MWGVETLLACYKDSILFIELLYFKYDASSILVLANML